MSQCDNCGTVLSASKTVFRDDHGHIYVRHAIKRGGKHAGYGFVRTHVVTHTCSRACRDRLQGQFHAHRQEIASVIGCESCGGKSKAGSDTTEACTIKPPTTTESIDSQPLVPPPAKEISLPVALPIAQPIAAKPAPAEKPIVALPIPIQAPMIAKVTEPAPVKPSARPAQAIQSELSPAKVVAAATAKTIAAPLASDPGTRLDLSEFT